MNKKLFAALLLAGITTAAIAQQKATAPKKEEKREIVIEEKSGKTNEKMVIVIDGEKVTINGKPAEQFKGKKTIVIDDDLVISGNRVVVPRNGKMTVTGGEPRALLGVITEKADNGAKVTEVMENTAAAKAGLKVGDVITSVNGIAISNEQALMETIRKFKPEQAVDITYLRDGKEKKVKATLGKTEDSFSWNIDEDFARDFSREFERNSRFYSNPPMATTIPPNVYFDGNSQYRKFTYRQDRPKFGMGVTDNPDGDGVKVSNVEAESNAAKAGLLKDDIITELDGHPIKNVDDLQEELADARDKSTMAIKVLRNGKTESLTLRVPKKIKSAEL